MNSMISNTLLIYNYERIKCVVMELGLFFALIVMSMIESKDFDGPRGKFVDDMISVFEFLTAEGMFGIVCASPQGRHGTALLNPEFVQYGTGETFTKCAMWMLDAEFDLDEWIVVLLDDPYSFSKAFLREVLFAMNTVDKLRFFSVMMKCVTHYSNWLLEMQSQWKCEPVDVYRDEEDVKLLLNDIREGYVQYTTCQLDELRTKVYDVLEDDKVAEVFDLLISAFACLQWIVVDEYER